MSVSDPVLYPAPQNTTEGLRQEALRSRADLTRTIEELTDRLSARQVVRPRALMPVGASVAVGVVAFALLRRVPAVRDLAWLGGLGAGIATRAVTRRRTKRTRPRPGRTVAVPPTAAHADVVTILVEHHRRIEREFGEVLAAQGPARVEAFASLVDILQHHERVEQEFVHQLVRPIAVEIFDARLDEEDAVNRALASLISLGVSNPQFEDGLIRLRQMVREHAEREETREFPVLQQHLGTEELRDLGGLVRWSP
jgi:hypothetical protein